MRRRDFLLGGSSLSAAWLLAACGSRGPRGSEKVLRYAERKNESLERALFRHTSMDSPSLKWRRAGHALPSYYIADVVPVWDTAARGVWTLEVSGLVQTPLKLTLDMLQRLPRVTKRVEALLRRRMDGDRELDRLPAQRHSESARERFRRRATSISSRSTTVIMRAGTSRARRIRKHSSRTAWMATCSRPRTARLRGSSLP